jgi:hypothetical protein
MDIPQAMNGFQSLADIVYYPPNLIIGETVFLSRQIEDHISQTSIYF